MLCFQEGDCIGLMRKSSGALHYYVNGLDQGVAAARTHQTVWGVVDLYGMAVKVTIIDHTTDDCRDINRRDGAWAALVTSANQARLNLLAAANSEEEGKAAAERGLGYWSVLIVEGGA